MFPHIKHILNGCWWCLLAIQRRGYNVTPYHLLSFLIYKTIFHIKKDDEDEDEDEEDVKEETKGKEVPKKMEKAKVAEAAAKGGSGWNKKGSLWERNNGNVYIVVSMCVYMFICILMYMCICVGITVGKKQW